MCARFGVENPPAGVQISSELDLPAPGPRLAQLALAAFAALALVARRR